MIQVISLVSFLWLWFSFCLPSDGWWEESSGSFLMERAHCGENWILLLWARPWSVNLNPVFCWWVWLRSLCIVWPASIPPRIAAVSVSDPVAGQCWLTPPLETPEHSPQVVESLLLSPGSWRAQFCSCTQESRLPQSCGSSVILSHWPSKSNSLGALKTYARSPGWEICCEPYNFLNCARTSLV